MTEPPDPIRTLIIPCAGDGKRWGNYLSRPKFMLAPEGEPLVCRTARLIAERAPGLRVVMVTREPVDLEPGTCIEQQRPEPHTDAGCQKLLHSRSHWSEQGRTLIVWGDVWLSEHAADCMCGLLPRHRPLPFWFGRSKASEHTGKPHAELWGLSFYPEAHLPLERDALVSPMGIAWFVYSQLAFGTMLGKPHKPSPHLCEIDDSTEDFDVPGDYHRWVDCRLAHMRGENGR